MKGKVCPTCGTFNKLNNIICTGCGEDLLRVPVTDGGEAAKETVEPSEEIWKPSTYFRKCPRCQRVNPYHLNRCRCGTLLLTLPPYEEGKEEITGSEEKKRREERETLFLISEDGRFKLELHVGDELFLGRKETGADYFYAKTFVSGKHLKVRVNMNGVFVEHVGKTNPTLVNHIQIKPNTPYSISINDKISLGARPGQEFVAEAAYLKLVSKEEQ